MQIFLFLKSLIFKLINKLFGQTRIFLIILGLFLAITGIWMLFSPEKAKKSLSSRGFGIVKGYLLMFALSLGMLLLSISGKSNGILSPILLLAGIFLIARAYLLLKKKAAYGISTWIEKAPVKLLKVYAIIQTIIGIVVLLLERRIWY